MLYNMACPFLSLSWVQLQMDAFTTMRGKKSASARGQGALVTKLIHATTAHSCTYKLPTIGPNMVPSAQESFTCRRVVWLAVGAHFWNFSPQESFAANSCERWWLLEDFVTWALRCMQCKSVRLKLTGTMDVDFSSSSIWVCARSRQQSVDMIAVGHLACVQALVSSTPMRIVDMDGAHDVSHMVCVVLFWGRQLLALGAETFVQFQEHVWPNDMGVGEGARKTFSLRNCSELIHNISRRGPIGLPIAWSIT